MTDFWTQIQLLYESSIVATGKQAQLVVLVTFLITFGLIRFITHSIRDQRYRMIFRNVSTKSGTHIHHLVPGIFLLLISGFFGIAVVSPEQRAFLAVPFGVGAALTLDEFALWLHLEDNYWSKQGRTSIDAVVIAATLVAIGITGLSFVVDLAWAIQQRLPGF